MEYLVGKGQFFWNIRTEWRLVFFPPKVTGYAFPPSATPVVWSGCVMSPMKSGNTILSALRSALYAELLLCTILRLRLEWSVAHTRKEFQRHGACNIRSMFEFASFDGIHARLKLDCGICNGLDNAAWLSAVPVIVNITIGRGLEV